MRENIINFVMFQIGWFACVLSAAAQQPLIGLVTALFILGVHIWRAQYRRNEFYLIVFAMLIGGVWDSLLVWFGLLEYSAGVLLPHTAPYWIIALWALFASTLNVSLRWLRTNMGIAVLLGAIAGPLAYYAGARLGALEIVNVNYAFLALAIGWAIFTPLLLTVSKRLDGYPVFGARELSWT